MPLCQFIATSFEPYSLFRRRFVTLLRAYFVDSLGVRGGVEIFGAATLHGSGLSKVPAPLIQPSSNYATCDIVVY